MITRILRISDHPLTKHSENLKEDYVRGLGCVLHVISNGNLNMRLLFEQWGYSILNNSVARYFQSEDKTYIGRALALNRVGMKFFRVKHQFYFDCFYLTEAYDRSLLGDLHDFLLKAGANIFTKSALTLTNAYFSSGDTALKVEEILQRHRHDNLSFASKYTNKILVVATVSAGKSTLINALIGYFFNRASTGVCTTRICRIHNKPIPDGITLNVGHSSYQYGECPIDYSSEDASEVGVHYESLLGSHKVCIIDTPGVNNAADSEHFKITAQEIKSQEYDCVIFISNGLYNGTNDEARLLSLLRTEVKKPIVFVLNQLDRFNSKRDNISKMIYDYAQELLSIGFKDFRIFPLSAQYALLLRNESLLNEDEADDLTSMRKRFANPFFDMQRYSGTPSANELEKSGIILLEKEIINHLR